MKTGGNTTTYAYYTYDEFEVTQNHRYLWPAVLRELPPNSGTPLSVLDAGCGTGAFAAVLRDRKYEVSAFDLSESGIELARKSAPGIRFESLSVYDNLIEDFQTPFDVIISIEVIEHLYDPDTSLRRLREVIKPEGTLILTTPYHGYLKNLLIAAGGRCDAHYTPLKVGGHIKFWSRKTLETLLSRNGFRVKRFRGVGRMPGLWKSHVVVARPV